MKELYYTVVRGISTDGETLDGTKSASVYCIENNIPKCICDVNMDLTDNTVNHIQMHLENELDMDIKTIKLIIL